MSVLVEAQRLLAAAIDQGANAAETARLHSLIASQTGRFGAGRRLSVYRDSSRRAREQALVAIYPVCRQVLGHRCFATLAAAYVAEYPSRSEDLNLYGDAFARHLERKTRDHAALAQAPYLGDLAFLEWHWHAAYYAPDDPVFDMVRFSALAAEGRAEQARFRLSAALRLLASDYPISEIWRRHREGGDTSAVAMGGGDRLAIRRADFRPRIDSIAPETFEVLTALSKGNTLSNLADEGHAVEKIPELIAAGWIVAFSVPDDA